MSLLRRVGAFCQTLSYCFRNARGGLRACAQREGLEPWVLLLHYLWHTVTDLLEILLYQLFTFHRRVTPAPSDAVVVVLVPGYLMSTKGMPALKAMLTARGYHVAAVRGVLTLRSRKDIRKQALALCREHQDKRLVLFGYSFGGSIAHALGAELGIPSISLSTPLESKGAPFGAIMNLFGIDNYRDPVIPELGMNFVEAFSETIPHRMPDGVRRTWTIDGVHSHFSINNPKVVLTLTEAVERTFPGAAPQLGTTLVNRAA
ncbi:MAG: hypothetical protein AB2A00_05340 [Myxococcota bacterium]